MTERELDSKVAAFFGRLDRLDAGERARFKRSAGQPLAGARDVLGLFYHVLPPGVPAYQEAMYFLAATLYPMAEGGGKGDLGDSLRQAQQSKNTKGLDRRVEILLDSDEAQLPFRLRQAIHFLQSNRVRVNWPRLLDDLLYWTHPDRFIQRRWARSYFAESQVSF
jgi:CRISPR system Cascade subunit CasB